MTRYTVSKILYLPIMGALLCLFPRLLAADCACPKPKVTISQISDYSVDIFCDGQELPSDGVKEMERDKSYAITIAVEPDPEYGQCGGFVELTFPHCTIEYSTDSGGTWIRGTRTTIFVDFNAMTYSPASVLIRITGEPSDDAKGCSGAPGDKANTQSSPPAYKYDSQTASSVAVPPGIGMEVPMGAVSTPEGYRSAGLLVNYGPVSPVFAAPSYLRYNGLAELSAFVTEYVQTDSGAITERHFIVPKGVLRVRGWNSTTQSQVNWQGAQETSIEVYDFDKYVLATHTFTGAAHSFYRLEVATGNDLQPGLKLVQSNHGVMSTRTMQSSSDGFTLRDEDGPRVTVTHAIPPEQGSTGWQRQITSTNNGVVVSSVLEFFVLQGTSYVMVSSVEDPSALVGDELSTDASYYPDGRVRSISKTDGSWSYFIYNGNTTTTYSPWLSSPKPFNDAGEWVQPSSGKALKTESWASVDGSSSDSYIDDFAAANQDVQISHRRSIISDSSGFTLTTNEEGTGDWNVMSYSLAYPDNSSDRFLAGRTVMSWEATGRATFHEYEKDANGASVRETTLTGYIANPTGSSTTTNFSSIPALSTKEVTITTDVGIVREETHVCISSGSYQLAVAKDHEFEPSGQRRPTGTKINGVYVSKTQYFSSTVTRQWNEEGVMTETETNAEGEVMRSAVSGNANVPSVTTTYDQTGLTSTTAVNGHNVSVEISDAASRIVHSEDASGAVTKTDYELGGRRIIRTGPGGVGVGALTVEERHYDGKPLSTTGTGVIPTFYTYVVDSSGFVTTTTSSATENDIRNTSVTRLWDGSTKYESSPDPKGAAPVVLTYSYGPNSSNLIRVHSSAANTAARIQLDPATSAAAALRHYSLSGSEINTDGPVIASTDRLTETSTSFVLSDGVWNQQTVSLAFYTQPDGSTGSYSQTSLQALEPVAVSDSTYGSGLRWTSSTSIGTTKVTSYRDVFFDGAAVVLSTDDTATTNSSDSRSVSLYGRTVSSAAYGTTFPETMIYDASGRIFKTTSPTGATTTYGYNDLGQLETLKDHDNKTTTYFYYPITDPNAGKLWKATNPETETVETSYNLRGQVTETSGNGTYRIKYDYNPYGEKDRMWTYRSSGSTGDLTQWKYDDASGVLNEKTDALNQKTTYTYYSSGRLETRTWARPGTVKTTYTYNPYGDLTFTDYSDTTPDVTVVPDRLGRPSTITDGSGSRTLIYHSVSGGSDFVSYGSGLLPSLQIDYTSDTSLRPSGYSVSGGGPSSVVGYDAAGRFYTVAASGITHTNSYFPGTGTRANLTTTEGSTTILSRTLYHDRMQRLRGIVTANASDTALSRHGYTLDNAGRRKTATRENGQCWDYGYDTLGQVTSALKKFPDGTTPIPGHAFSYVYDGIGNRKSAVQGGTGMAVAYPEGNTNAINQYKRIETEDGRYIFGEAPSGNAVIINGDPTAAARPGGLGFYWKQLTDSNSTAPLWSNDSVVSNGDTIAGRTWTPAAVVVPIYDEDGNLKYDGRWDYSWDAENRLIQMKASSAALAAATASGIPCEKLDFAYDSQGRRISKTVSTSTNGTSWTFARNQRFLYDGWNLIAEYSTAELTPDSLTLQATHTWGIDLSGAPQGAGGVGGLLATHLVAAPASACYPAYDGNGNISAWIDGAGVLLGRMDYSPFGQLITQYKFTPTVSTTLARLGFGFSTKYTDAESGLLYYGYRYYDPVNGRWPSRDPIEEEGGINLYGFVRNSPSVYLDKLGRMLTEFTTKVEDIKFVETDFKTDGQLGYAPNPFPNEKIGFADAGHTTEKVKPHACRVWVKGEMKIVLQKKRGMLDSQNGWDGVSILKHERVHAQIYKDYWVKLMRAINWINDTKGGYNAGSDERAINVIGFAEAALKFYSTSAMAEGAELDMKSYGRDHSDTPMGVKAVENAALYKSLLQVVTREYQDATNKVN